MSCYGHINRISTINWVFPKYDIKTDVFHDITKNNDAERKKITMPSVLIRHIHSLNLSQSR